MNARHALLAVTALALVTACNRGSTDNRAAGNGSTSANSAAPAGPLSSGGGGAGTTGGGGAIDQATLIGHWGMGGDCSETVSFNADGTATATGEEDPIRWTLEGNTIVTVEGEDQPERVTVARSGDGLTITQSGGDSIQLTRCQAAATAAPGGPGAAQPGATPDGEP